MAKKLTGVIYIILFVLFCGHAEARKAATADQIKELKQLIEKQEKALGELKTRVRELESEVTPDSQTVEIEPVPAEPAEPEKNAGAAPSPAEDYEAKMAKRALKLDPVPFQNSLDDRQGPAPRPKGYTFDPQYRGFIQIPRTAFMIKFNPKPRVDLTFDTNNSGDDFRFVPAKIPLDGTPEQGGGEQFNANGNGSQLRVDMRAPDLKGNFRFYYQNDFFGSDEKNFQYRLQHLYAQYYGVTAGFTYGVFEDPDAWPDTVDYEGTNSTIFARRPLVHYTYEMPHSTNITFGVEDPDFFVDTSGDPDAIQHKRIPDMGFNFRWEPKGKGHIQFSTIFRSLGVQSGLFGDQNTFAWGLNLGGSFNFTKRDMIQFLGVYGFGVGGMGNDTSFVDSDAAFNANGDLVPLQYISALLGYTHNWTPRMRSTLSYGFANLGNTALQDDDAYNFTHYGSANFIFSLLKRLNIGVEGLYGYRQVKNGDHGDVFRAQLSLMYSLFD